MSYFVLSVYVLSVILWYFGRFMLGLDITFEIFIAASLASLKSMVGYQLRKDSCTVTFNVFFKKNVFGGMIMDMILFFVPLALMVYCLGETIHTYLFVLFSFGFYFLLLTAEVFFYYKTCLHFRARDRHV